MLLFVWAVAVCVGYPIFSGVIASHTAPEAGGKHVGSPYAYQLNAYWLAALPAAAVFVLLFLDTGT